MILQAYHLDVELVCMGLQKLSNLFPKNSSSKLQLISYFNVFTNGHFHNLPQCMEWRDKYIIIF